MGSAIIGGAILLTGGAAIPAILAGGAIGGVMGAGMQVWDNYWNERPLSGIDWGAAGWAAFDGAVAGAIAGVLPQGTGLVGTASAEFVSGRAMQVTQNVMTGEAWDEDLWDPASIALDVIPGVGAAPLARAVGRGLGRTGRAIKNAANVASDLAGRAGRSLDNAGRWLKRNMDELTPRGQVNNRLRRLNQAGCGNSFTAGTPVETEDGLVPIEDIAIGDKVLAEDPDTGQQGYFEVVALTSHPADEIIEVRLDLEGDSENNNNQQLNNEAGEDDPPAAGAGAGSDSAPPTMQVTPEHPVYVEGKGWLWAENLAIGDRLRRADGGLAKVLAIDRLALDEPQRVYNFTVRGPHTYFVLEVGVLVHNVGCRYNPVSERFHTTEKLKIDDTEYTKGSFISSDKVKRLTEQWVQENLEQGNVGTVLKRFGIDPEATWVKKSGLIDELGDLGKKIKSGEIPPTEALRRAILEVLPEGYTFAGRSIPEGSPKYHGLLPPKPEGAIAILKGPNGVRIIADAKKKMGEVPGELYLVVSDLDPGALLDPAGRVVNDTEFIKIFIKGERFNEAFARYLGIPGARMMDHGTQLIGQILKVRGKPEGFKNVPDYASLEEVYVITKGKDQDFRAVRLPDLIRQNAPPDDPLAQEFLEAVEEIWKGRN